MVVRKTYDHWGIEISTWNKSNIVTFIDCDCGQLAKRELGKYNQFKCDSCNKEYKLWGTWNIETKMHGRKANNCR
ncbi:hypothetical protein PUW56_14325 (plasmid) [Enterococcus faecalis]|nr:hypothetical protein PUW56_14325 [Enterococcus faecalis]